MKDQFLRFKKGNYVVLYEIKNNFFSIRGINSLIQDKIIDEEFTELGVLCIEKAIKLELDGLSLRTPNAFILLAVLNNGLPVRVFRDYKEIHDIEELKLYIENITLNYLKIPNSKDNICVTPIMTEEELIGNYLTITQLNDSGKLPFVYLEYDENNFVTNISYNQPAHDTFTTSWNNYIGDIEKYNNKLKVVNNKVVIVN